MCPCPPFAPSLITIDSLGCPNLLPAPQEITATRGFTTARNSDVVEVSDPWCPTLRTVQGSSARSQISSHSVSLITSAVNRKLTPPSWRSSTTLLLSISDSVPVICSGRGLIPCPPTPS